MSADTRVPWTTKNKVGLGLAILYGLANVPSVLFAASEDGTGPPMSIMIVCSILGIVTIAGAVVAWRTGSRTGARLVAGSVIIMTLTSLPAFFVDVPAAVKALVATSVLLTVAILVLLFSSQPRVVD